MITLEHVSRRYGDKVAVRDLSLTVEAGKVCVLIGPSGCGKTTTLRMINRLIEPSSGRILIDGADIMGLRPEQLRRGLGYVIQSTGLFPHLTVAENISVVPRLLGWTPARQAERATELLSLVGLDPDAYRDRYPRVLSGGEAQRVGVARALAADPPALLMDEPFGAVDPLTRERLQTEFLRIQRELKKTVIFVTHDIDEAVRLADRVAVMRDAALEQYDTPEELLEHPANRFVHDFVGADRALKLLTRVRVGDVMGEAVSVSAGSEEGALAASRGHRFVYVVDGGTLVGWLDTRDVARGMPVAESITKVDPEEMTVSPDDSVRDALSRMLGLGFRSIAVTDAGRLVGEVTLAMVEERVADREEG